MTINDIHTKIEHYKVKGFLADNEAEALFYLASKACLLGSCLEVGSYCGKSSVYIGEACKSQGGVLYALDHHRGSEEHQLGEEYHDSDLYDLECNAFDSFPSFRATLKVFRLEHAVIPVVSASEVVAKHWSAPLGMVFIDGGHSPEMSMKDCMNWSKHIVPGGIMAIHDIFERPEDGGQGPYLALNAVVASGDFKWLEKVGSLGILTRC